MTKACRPVLTQAVGFIYKVLGVAEVSRQQSPAYLEVATPSGLPIEVCGVQGKKLKMSLISIKSLSENIFKSACH